MQQYQQLHICILYSYRSRPSLAQQESPSKRGRESPSQYKVASSIVQLTCVHLIIVSSCYKLFTFTYTPFARGIHAACFVQRGYAVYIHLSRGCQLTYTFFLRVDLYPKVYTQIRDTKSVSYTQKICVYAKHLHYQLTETACTVQLKKQTNLRTRWSRVSCIEYMFYFSYTILEVSFASLLPSPPLFFRFILQHTQQKRERGREGEGTY